MTRELEGQGPHYHSVVLVAVAQDQCELKYVSAEHKNDKEVALAAVAQAGYALIVVLASTTSLSFLR